jgi:putative iron-dependent peroxidase
MSKPQSVILPEPAECALFLVLEVEGRKRNARAVAEAAAAIPELTRRLGTRPRSQLVSAIAFGRKQWDAISPDRRPEGFRPFRAIGKGKRRAPATGGDLLLHAVSREADLCFELAFELRRALGAKATVMDEVHGFRYRDSRDLTGFIDGTENPKGREREEVALIGDEDPDFAGGSFVFTQRYIHDLAKWGALADAYQEGVIGRTKQDSRELSDDVKPDTAHIARVVIEEDGHELEIVRHSMPYGTTSEHGLFFIAYTKDLSIPTKMLSRMQGTSGDGKRDALMQYTRAVSGAHFFAPSLATLASL